MAEDNGRNLLPLPRNPIARTPMSPSGPSGSSDESDSGSGGPGRQKPTASPHDFEARPHRSDAHRTRNPVHFILLLGLGALIAGALALGLFFISPSSIGLLREEYVGQEVLSFQRVVVDDPYLKIDVKDGQLVPTYRGPRVTGVVILGNGLYRLVPPPEQADVLSATLASGNLQDSFTAIYLPLTYQELEEMKDRSSAKPTDSPPSLERARTIVSDLKRELRLVGIFGVNREFQSGAESEAIQIFGDQFGRVRMYLGRQVTLNFPSSGLRFSFPNLYSGTGMFFLVYAQPKVLPISVLLLAVMVGFLGAMVYVLTVDSNPAYTHRSIIEREAELRDWPPRASLYAAGIISFYLILAALVGAYLPGRIIGTLADLVVAGFILRLFLRAKVTWKRLGLRREELTRSLLVGGAVGFLTVSAGALSFPAGLQHLSPLGLVRQFYWSFLVIGLARTVIFHAYLQTWLQNRHGRVRGLVATAFLVGILFSLPAALIRGTAILPALLENVVVVPAMTALNGFLFQRTGNVFGPALSRALVDFLPAFFRY